jgi:hypothetical protein
MMMLLPLLLCTGRIQQRSVGPHSIVYFGDKTLSKRDAVHCQISLSSMDIRFLSVSP